MVGRVVEFCAARGHDAAAFCREVGFNPGLLIDDDARVGYDVVARAGARALALTRDANFGLHLAGDVGRPATFDAGLLLLMASPTVRVALERMVRHQRFWGDGPRSTLVPVSGGLIVRYDLRSVWPDAEEPYARHADECAMAELALGLRALSGKDVRARAVRFRHAPPPSVDEHRALFGAPLIFRAPRELPRQGFVKMRSRPQPPAHPCLEAFADSSVA